MEIEALLRWKESLPPQSILDSWVVPSKSNSSATNPCQWRGISCKNQSSITKIYLNYTGLIGTLEYLNFSSFPNLLRLDLKVNNLSGVISPSIGVLSKLEFLDLSTNSLNITLPLSLANLTNVFELDVSRNFITGSLDPRLFPDGPKDPKTRLKSLRNFLLQDTELGGRVPKEIGNVTNLTLIAFDRCQFSGPIPQSLRNLPSLNILCLNDNHFSREIHASIANLKNLTDLRLFINDLSGEVPQNLGNMSVIHSSSSRREQFCGSFVTPNLQSTEAWNFSTAYNSFSDPIRQPERLSELKGVIRMNRPNLNQFVFFPCLGGHKIRLRES